MDMSNLFIFKMQCILCGGTLKVASHTWLTQLQDLSGIQSICGECFRDYVVAVSVRRYDTDPDDWVEVKHEKDD